MKTKICPSCQKPRPVEDLIKIRYRKVLCVECNGTRLVNNVLVKQRLQNERKRGLL